MARRREKTVRPERVRMRGLEGGIDLEEDGARVGGAVLEMAVTRVRRPVQMAAVERSEARKPKTRIREILARSGAGRAGASGSMTRFGTKKRASQRVRKATPGLKRRVFVRSTSGVWFRRRRVVMRAKRRSIAASGAGKEMLARARRCETARWMATRRVREKAWETKDLVRVKGDCAGWDWMGAGDASAEEVRVRREG